MKPKLAANYQLQVCKVLCVVLFFQACTSSNSTNTGGGLSAIFTPEKINITSITTFITSLKDNPSALPKVIMGDSVFLTKELLALYEANNYEPIWLYKGGISKKATQFIEATEQIKYDGFNTDDFKLKELKKYIQSIDKETENIETLKEIELGFSYQYLLATHAMQYGLRTPKEIYPDWKNKNDSIYAGATLLKSAFNTITFNDVFDSLRPKHFWYEKFRTEYRKLDSIKVQGGWTTIQNIKDSIQIGFTSDAIPQLRKRLQKELGIPKDIESKSWDIELVDAVKKFQHIHNIKNTGFLDSTTLTQLNIGIDKKIENLALNMERMRWLKKDFPQPYIFVNVPRMDLDYVEHDSILWNMRVVVGRTSRATPTLDSKIEDIVFNPPWSVPPTIMKEEIVPGIARKGGSYLSRRGLKAYRGGRLVNPSLINANNYKSFAICQQPGYNSSLGCVKFNMPNPWSIYMHDTPHRSDFARSYRAYSSGCIRLHKPREFAEFLLNDTTYTRVKIDSIVKTKQTLFVPMKKDIEVHIVYLTNGLDSAGNVTYLKDIYNLDEKIKMKIN